MFFLIRPTRFGAAVLSSLLLAAGCRSASVNPAPTSSGLTPFFRSFDRPPRPPVEDTRSYPSPTPGSMAPAILPAPGYSEPSEPLEQEVPPPPSAKKSKWNFLPSGLKLSSNSLTNKHVHQTAAKAENSSRTKFDKLDSSNSLTRSTPSNSETLTEETVQSRFASTGNGPTLSAPEPNSIPPFASTASKLHAPSIAVSPTEVITSQPAPSVQAAPRSTVRNPWPSSRNVVERQGTQFENRPLGSNRIPAPASTESIIGPFSRMCVFGPAPTPSAGGS